MKRLLLIFTLICMAAINAAAQAVVQTPKTEEDGFQWVEERKGPNVGARESTEGRWLVPRKYYYVSYKSGYDYRLPHFIAYDRKKNTQLLYTPQGKRLIPARRGYNLISCHSYYYFDDSSHMYQAFYYGVHTKEGMGICNTKGRQLIFLKGAQSIRPTYEKGHFYYLVRKDNLYGIMDGKGRIVIETTQKNGIICTFGKFKVKDEEAKGGFRDIGDIDLVTTSENLLPGEMVKD
ncbi:MAG: hypothetical protein K6G08_09220 [Prevotella sp.]|nr:hypothetical protein [Prevotella sp.]